MTWTRENEKWLLMAICIFCLIALFMMGQDDGFDKAEKITRAERHRVLCANALTRDPSCEYKDDKIRGEAE